MAEYRIVAMEEITDENGMILYSPIIQNVNKKKPLERLMYDGMQIVSGAALAACMWKLKFYPFFPLGFCAMSIGGAVDFYKHLQKHIRDSSLLLRERIRSTTLLVTGTITYFANVALFSRALKQNNKMWIPYLGVAAVGYFLSVWANNLLERTVLSMTPVVKCCHLLLGPTLIGSAVFYLLRIQKHDEVWLWWLSLAASTALAKYIAINGNLRGRNRREPRWLLYKGFELILGGGILCFNAAVLELYAMNNYIRYKQLLFVLICNIVICNGLDDVIEAIKCFRRYARIEEVYDCFFGMILGPTIIFSACFCFIVKRFIMLPGFLLMSGTGLALLGLSLLKLHDLVPCYVYRRYVHQILGPVVIAYGTLVSSYVGYRLGWRFSAILMPLMPFGINATYRGRRE